MDTQTIINFFFLIFLTDSCGVENFEFETSVNDTEDAEWIGGNVTKPEGNHWIYESPELQAKVSSQYQTPGKDVQTSVDRMDRAR